MTPQLVPATALRGGAAETLTEVLELPHPESDLLIKVRMKARSTTGWEPWPFNLSRWQHQRAWPMSK
ncbi:MAG: hypothetical protein R2867_16575 [Caldilineaceae bacterium]